MLLALFFLFLQTIGDLGVDVKAMKMEVEKLKEKVEKELADLKQQQISGVCSVLLKVFYVIVKLQFHSDNFFFPIFKHYIVVPKISGTCDKY